MDKNIVKSKALLKKKRSVRKKIAGSAERPRLSVFRSESHIYGQIIDDEAGVTLISASTVTKALRGEVKGLKPEDAAKKVGEALAEAATAQGITNVVFDRNGRRFAGRVASLAAGAREKGLQF